MHRLNGSARKIPNHEREAFIRFVCVHRVRFWLMLHAVEASWKASGMAEECKVWQKKESRSGGEMGRREKHVWRGENGSLQLNSLGMCRLRGCKRQANLYNSVHAGGWEGKKHDEWESEGMAIFMQCSGPSSLTTHSAKQSATNDGLNGRCDDAHAYIRSLGGSALVLASIRLSLYRRIGIIMR